MDERDERIAAPIVEALRAVPAERRMRLYEALGEQRDRLASWVDPEENPEFAEIVLGDPERDVVFANILRALMLGLREIDDEDRRFLAATETDMMEQHITVTEIPPEDPEDE